MLKAALAEETPLVIEKKKSSKSTDKVAKQAALAEETPLVIEKKKSSKSTDKVAKQAALAEETPLVIEKKKSSKSTDKVAKQVGVFKEPPLVERNRRAIKSTEREISDKLTEIASLMNYKRYLGSMHVLESAHIDLKEYKKQSSIYLKEETLLKEKHSVEMTIVRDWRNKYLDEKLKFNSLIYELKLLSESNSPIDHKILSDVLEKYDDPVELIDPGTEIWAKGRPKRRTLKVGEAGEGSGAGKGAQEKETMRISDYGAEESVETTLMIEENSDLEVGAEEVVETSLSVTA